MRHHKTIKRECFHLMHRYNTTCVWIYIYTYIHIYIYIYKYFIHITKDMFPTFGLFYVVPQLAFSETDCHVSHQESHSDKMPQIASDCPVQVRVPYMYMYVYNIYIYILYYIIINYIILYYIFYFLFLLYHIVLYNNLLFYYIILHYCYFIILYYITLYYINGQCTCSGLYFQR